MEEDTGKSLHVGGSTGRIHGADHSLVDYNRAGIPLIEIVTKPITGAGERAPEVARAYVAAAARPAPGARTSPTCAWSRARCAATPTCRSRAGRRQRRSAGHPHRDQERQLVAVGRAGRALRDQPPGGDPRRRRRDHPGDAALARGHRRHDVRPREVRRRGLPLLPGARPGAGRAAPRAGSRSSAADAARAAGRATQAAAGRLGLHATPRCATSSTPAPSSSSRRPSPRAPPGRPRASGGWASWPGAANAERDVELRGAAGDAGADRPAGGAGRRRPAQRHAGPPGARGRARRRGLPGAVADARGLEVVSDDGALEAPSTPRSRPTPTSRRRSAAARSRPPARSSARS